jgi:hypothetical protein
MIEVAVERRDVPDLVLLAKEGNRRLAKFVEKLERQGFYGRITIDFKDGQAVGTIETAQTFRVVDVNI